MLVRLQTIPVEFLNREAIALALSTDTLRDVNGLNSKLISTLIEAINSQELSELIEKGEITVAMMKSGPTTVLLLHSGDGQAIQHWRKLVGHWDIVDTNQPETIRGKYGKDNYNNLIHGSDSPDSVKNELGLITQQLAKTYDL